MYAIHVYMYVCVWEIYTVYVCMLVSVCVCVCVVYLFAVSCDDVNFKGVLKNDSIKHTPNTNTNTPIMY